MTNSGNNLLFRNNGDGTFTRRGRRRPASRPGAGAPAARSSTPTATGTSTSTSRATCTPTWDDVANAERTLDLAGRPEGDGRSRRDCPERPTSSSRTAATGRSSRPRPRTASPTAPSAYGFGVLATDYDDDGWPDLFVANDSEPELPLPQPRERHVRERGPPRRRRGQRRGARPGRHGRRRRGLRRRRPPRPRPHHLRPRHEDALPEPRRQPVRGRERRSGLAAATFGPMGWGAAFLDADLDGRLDLFLANGHIFPNVDDFPELKETFRQRNQLLLNDGGTFRDVTPTRPAAGCRSARASRGLAVGDLDDDGDLDVVVTNMDDIAHASSRTGRATGHHWVGLPRAAPGREPLRDRRAGDDRRRRSAPGPRGPLREAATSRRATCGPSSASAPGRSPWTSRSACRAARAGGGTRSRSTASTTSRSRRRIGWRGPSRASPR